MKHITAKEDDIAERSNFEVIRRNEQGGEVKNWKKWSRKNIVSCKLKLNVKG